MLYICWHFQHLHMNPGTIWGIEGMFLSVPLTVSIAIVCANFPAVNWIAILLSIDGDLGKDKNEGQSHEEYPNR